MKQDHPICGMCHRVLKSLKSRRFGYGPVCKKKYEHEQLLKEKEGLHDSSRSVMQA
ncbi:DUF6011 domain-containing protein [Robertmurraya sp.]|uniref:DUF6011 domain-containing protein n=1 Tax=Robertmurraya sp. TaxID=2837525 RepID=UPI0037036EF3